MGIGKQPMKYDNHSPLILLKMLARTIKACLGYFQMQRCSVVETKKWSSFLATPGSIYDRIRSYTTTSQVSLMTSRGPRVSEMRTIGKENGNVLRMRMLSSM